MTTLSVLVGICIWILGFYKLKAHGALMGSLNFFFMDRAKVIVLLSLFA